MTNTERQLNWQVVVQLESFIVLSSYIRLSSIKKITFIMSI